MGTLDVSTISYSLMIVNVIGISIVIFGLLLYSYRFIYLIFSFKKIKPSPNTDKKAKFAVLIPARNESAVIGNIIESLKNQTYDPEFFDVYVIVESETDKTVEITKNANYNIVIRGDLENRRTKGFALDDALQHILKSGLKYDAYFVFDADNTLCSNYIEEMNKCYQEGYQLTSGFRNSKNANENWISGCSAITFTMLNALNSKPRSKLFDKVVLSGTGFYIDANIVNKEGHWIWNGLAEDCELTYYCLINNIKCHYVDHIEFYDEQPTSMKTIKSQHIRWIKGRSTAAKRYMNQIRKLMCKSFCAFDYALSIYPVIIIAIGAIFHIIATLVIAIMMAAMHISISKNYGFFSFIVSISTVYLMLAFYSFLLVSLDGKRLNFSFFFGLRIGLLNPIFFLTYIPHSIKSLSKANSGWTPIIHSGKKSQKSKKSKDIMEGKQIEIDIGIAHVAETIEEVNCDFS